MGYFAGVSNLISLQLREIDVKAKIMEIMATIDEVGDYSAELVTIGDDLDPKSSEYKKLKDKKEKLKLMEKRLQSELTQSQNRLKFIGIQINTTQQITDSSIARLSGSSAGA